MNIFSTMRIALTALLVNKGRSVLTSLGIVIGVGAVIAMVSAGNGFRDFLDNGLRRVGTNLIIIKGGGRTQQGIVTDPTTLSFEDAKAIRSKVGHLLQKVAETQMTQRIVSTRHVNHATVLVGSMPELREIRAWNMKRGQFYTKEHVANAASVCLLGHATWKKLFPDKPDPIGETVRVGNVQLRVIGVLEEKGRMPTGADQDDQIFLPVTTLQRKITGNDKLTIILTAAKSESQIAKAKDEIVKLMRERHQIKPGAKEDFDVSTVSEMANLAVIVTAAMQILIALMMGISLLVGGIGIMNIMLVSVTERTREIGIRMAIGATPANVLSQFLIEAIVLALVGGILGIVLGLASAVAVAHYVDWPLVIQPEMVIAAFLVAASIGIFFGFYPARKASRLDPIESLRYE
jgi:putative ABC transport system permease protein